MLLDGRYYTTEKRETERYTYYLSVNTTIQNRRDNEIHATRQWILQVTLPINKDRKR